MEKEEKNIKNEAVLNEEKNKNKEEKASPQKLIFVIISAVILILLAFLIFKFSPEQQKNLKINEAKIEAENFINENLMMPGTKARVMEIKSEHGLYKLIVDVDMEEPIESYISKDGALFFPQAIDMEEYEEEMKAEQTPIEISQKKDRPEVELFVMSYCPYGSQMEDNLIPLLKLLGEKIDFKLRFNDYVMQDQEEINENLTQYCIQEEEKDKLLDYLNCFNSSFESSACLEELGINKNKISTCVKKVDQEFKITEKYNDASTWLYEAYPLFGVDQELNEKYGVQGSPTLVINEETIPSYQDPQIILETICSAFNNPPEECLEIF